MEISKFIEYLTDAGFFIVSDRGILQNEISEKQEIFYRFLISALRLSALFDEFKSHPHALLYTNRLGLYWLFVPHYREDVPVLLYMIGPFVTSSLNAEELKEAGLPDLFSDALASLRPISLSQIYDLERAFSLCSENRHLPLEDMEVLKYPLLDDSSFNSYQAKIKTNRSFYYEYLLATETVQGKGHDEIISDLSLSGQQMNHKDMTLEQYQTYFIGLAHILSFEAARTGIPENEVYMVTESIMQQVYSCKTNAEIEHMIWVLQDAIRYNVQLQRPKPGMSKSIISAQNFINNHLETPLTINDIAEPLGYTPYYFSTLFKKETGFSVNHYIKLMRCEKACFFLTFTSHNLQTISTLVGFSNQSVFSKCFKELKGLTPKQFRQVHSNDPNIV